MSTMSVGECKHMYIREGSKVETYLSFPGIDRCATTYIESSCFQILIHVGDVGIL